LSWWLSCEALTKYLTCDIIYSSFIQNDHSQKLLNFKWFLAVVGHCSKLLKTGRVEDWKSNTTGKAKTKESLMTNTSQQQVQIRNRTGKVIHTVQGKLAGANLSEVDLSEANLKGADLFGANLELAYLGEADLSSADLREAEAIGAHFPDADLRGAVLVDASLRGADIGGADIGGADFSEADLDGADFREAQHVESANFTGADFGVAQFS